MKITVIGCGYVGLVSAGNLADSGNNVLCLDTDQERVEGLQHGVIPIYEPGLTDLINKNVAAGRLSFTTDVEKGVKHGDIQMICVGTPSDTDGSANLSYLVGAVENIARYMEKYTIVVCRSTVPVRTADDVIAPVIQGILTERGSNIVFDVVSNPEFLRQGTANKDFAFPDTIIVGTGSDIAFAKIRELYAPYQRKKERVMRMSNRDAEFTKLLRNIQRMIRLSTQNGYVSLAEKLGVNMDNVTMALASDPETGDGYLRTSPGGVGGSCLVKDTHALVRFAEMHDEALPILRAVLSVNETHENYLFDRVIRHHGSIKGMKIAIWGLAFKPGTDDVRSSASIPLINALLDAGAEVIAYDPKAMKKTEEVFGPRKELTYAACSLSALDDVDSLVVLTEWKEFYSPPWDEMKTRMKSPVIFDGRNLFETHVPHGEGFTYLSIGRPDKIQDVAQRVK